MHNKCIFLFLILATCIILPAFTQQETITITTYYPAPFGVYQEMRAKHIAIGDTYYDQAQHAWATVTPAPAATDISQDADLVVEGNVGIGTFVPERQLHMRGYYNPPNSLGVAVIMEEYSVNASAADIFFQKARGTVDVPADVSVGDSLGTLDFSGFKDNAFRHSFEITPIVESVADANVYSGLTFRTGVDDAWTERMRISNDGKVGIGTDDPRAELDVNGEVKIGTDTGATCSSATGGVLRYNSSAKVMEYCDETNWVPLGSRIITGTYTGDGACTGGRRTIIVPGVTVDRPIKLLVITSGWDTSIDGNYPGCATCAAMAVPILFKTDTTGTYEHYINADVSESRTSDSGLAFETNGFSFERCTSGTPPALTNANKHGPGSLVITYHYFILN